MATKHFITTPIYYVNGEPHIGHAYTTVAADVLARFWRERDGAKSVFFLTGTDEHGTKVAIKAKELGKDTKQFTDEIAGQFKAAWQTLEISNDFFIRTTDVAHMSAVQEILKRLKAAKTPQGRDAIYESMYTGPYCVGCEKFLTVKDLIDGKCAIHKTIPERLEEKNWFFRLSDYLPQVRTAIEKGEMRIHPEERKNETLGLFGQGIDDFSISRSTVTWGVAIPWDPSQRAYVWLDALSNYITALGYPDDSKRVKEWWTGADVHQLMAADILKFHAVYWPALLLALGLPVPKHLHVHGYFTIDGEKMSKTTGNVIKPIELVSKFGVDATRYLLLSQFSFGYESDVRAEDFVTKYNADLANGLGNLLARVTNMIEKSLGGKVTRKIHGAPTLKIVGAAIEKLNFREALLGIWKLIDLSNEYIDAEKPWALAKSDPQKLAPILGELADDLHAIAGALRPFMPRTAEKIEKALTARPIVKYSGLFARIEG